MKQKFVFQWHLTHRCNLRCSHCYQEDYSADLPWQTLESIYWQIKEFAEKFGFRVHINFTGGEPLLCEHLFSLFDLCQRDGITFGLLTNGTMVSSAIASSLTRYSCLKFVQVSIDGLRGVHDRIRGKGSFNLAFRGIRELRRYGIQSMVAFTVCRENYGELQSVVRYCRRHGVDRFWADRLVPIGGCKEASVSAKEYAAAVELLAKEQRKEGMTVHTNRAIQFLYGGDCIYHCSAGSELLVVLADGTLLPCRRLPLVVGSLMENNISELFEKSSILQELRSFEYPEECSTCGVRHLCKGGAKCQSLALKGDWKMKDPGCCL